MENTCLENKVMELMITIIAIIFYVTFGFGIMTIIDSLRREEKRNQEIIDILKRMEEKFNK
jgi:hypothetical protein